MGLNRLASKKDASSGLAEPMNKVVSGVTRTSKYRKGTEYRQTREI